MPSVYLNLLHSCIPVGHRTIGGVTGSRVAGSLGLAIVAGIIHERADHWKQWGFKLENSCISLATWIDNIFAYGNSALSCIAILDDFEAVLVRKWQLEIKPSSREIVVCLGAENSADPAVWKHVENLNMLGHFVANSGGIRFDWLKVKAKMWGAFYGNSGSNDLHSVNFETKLSLLMRTVFCTVNWKFSRWPFQKSIAVEMDKLQVNMVAMVSRYPKLASEDWVGWIRRKRRFARNILQRIGFWSEAWALRQVNWHEHVERSPGVLRDLLLYHNSNWLQSMRSRFVPANGADGTRNSVLAGRTGTRTDDGKPQPRWEAGIELARAYVQSRGTCQRNKNAISVSSRIREAVSYIKEQFFSGRPP